MLTSKRDQLMSVVGITPCSIDLFHRSRYDLFLVSHDNGKIVKTLKDYQLLTAQAVALIEDEADLVANLSNISALLNMNLETINWVGFYLLKGDQLVLGPFQGNVACVRIDLDKGVCGKAFSTNTTQRIADVHDFPGHIACDAASQSEIVVPINVKGKTVGVLDIDSPITDRFTEIDEQGLTEFVKHISAHLECG